MTQAAPEAPGTGTTTSDPAGQVTGLAAEAVTGQATATGAEQAAAGKPSESLEYWKQKSRENEERAKANAKAAQELQKIQEANKTAEQKAQEAALQTQRDLEEARAETLRYRAAATHHVSAVNFDLLGVGDESTIDGRAKRVGALEAAMAELTALKAAQGEAATKAGQPQPIPGLKPGSPAVPDDSYPAGWFPSIKSRSTENSNTT